MRNLRVLVGAYACNPSFGSEEGVGWGWVKAIAQYHEVWVLTAEFHRRDLDEALRCGETRNRIHVFYVEPKVWHYRPTRAWTKVENSILKPIMHWAYRAWLIDAFILSKRLHREIEFDLVHQLTYVGFRFPGHLWKLGIPFIWGPIGGLENTPWRLLPAMGARGGAYYAARNVVNSAHKKFLRGPRKAFQRAGAIIAATSNIKTEIFSRYNTMSEVICEVGAPCETADEFARRFSAGRLNIAWSGRHMPGKALHLLLRALAPINESIDWRLDVYGDGPCRAKWQRLAVSLGIESRCMWHGQVPRTDAIAGLKFAHLFVITSLKDLTSSVILEALANGVPVVCPDHCGFSDVVNESCGIKLSLSSAAGFEAALSHTIVELAIDEPRRRRLAFGALKRARDFSWDAKAEAINRVYQRAIRAARERDLGLSAAATDASIHS